MSSFNVSTRFKNRMVQSRPVDVSLALKDRPVYDGKELRPFEGRPGSMDAFALPSMVSGIAVDRRAPILNSAKKVAL